MTKKQLTKKKSSTKGIKKINTKKISKKTKPGSGSKKTEKLKDKLKLGLKEPVKPGEPGI